jgi:hypothetical protein
MSRQIALDTIHLRPTPRLAHTDYSVEYHHDYITQLTGLAPGQPGCYDRLYELFGFDFFWGTDDGLHGDWLSRGRATDMGHAEYAADGSDRHDSRISPFSTPEQVWAFDPAAEYGLPDRAEQIATYERSVQAAAAGHPEQLTTGGYYKTIISGAIQAFGWDALLCAAADPRRFETVLDRFFRFTLHHMECWAATSVPVIIQHDDFVWTQGAFMRPEYYRAVIIPRYAELWKPLKAAGKKLLFCSDGNFLEFAADIVAAGADGLIFEPCMDFGVMAERFGDSTCLVGSFVDCRDMTFGTWDTVRAAMDRTFEVARGCKGVMFATGNHLPANIPPAMMEQYRQHLLANW